MTKYITFLQPIGATFSHDAYTALAKLFNAPRLGDSDVVYVPARTNGEVLGIVLENKGYGALAMETQAEGRIDESLEPFIRLLDRFHFPHECPIYVIGAVKLKLHFVLMVRAGIAHTDVKKILGHPRALGACGRLINLLGVLAEESSSNGQAAEDVALNPAFAKYAALGPRSAAEKYGLVVLQDACEDTEAITTFFLISSSYDLYIGEENRALIVFKTQHHPGALVDALMPFKREGLNLIEIHSVYAGNGTYNFAIEIACSWAQFADFQKAMEAFERRVQEYLLFGPFPVLSADAGLRGEQDALDQKNRKEG